MKSCIENSLHPFDSAIFFPSSRRYSDVSFGLFWGHFGADRVNQSFALAGGDLLETACRGQENGGSVGKSTGAEMLGLYGLAPSGAVRVNYDIVQIGATASS